MKKLHTEIEINATPTVVWGMLLDFATYPEWNPFIVAIDGDASVGSKLRVRLEPPEGRGATFRPSVTAIEQDRCFEWVGKLGFKGLFDGRHRFEIEATSRGTRFIHSEKFSGVLVPLLARVLDKGTRAGFEAMNLALKERVEAAQVERDQWERKSG